MRVTVLCGQGVSTNILLNWLEDNGFSDVEAIIEHPVSRYRQLRYRWSRLGPISTLGQLLFLAIVLPFLRRSSLARRREILSCFRLRDEVPRNTKIHTVASINGPEVIERLQDRQPEIVLVNGTRIIRAPVLNAIEAPVINTHVGITPEYRGIHGGYWSLWNRDPENFGVTLHLVDSGVDTGPVLAQERTKPAREDNFASYPLLQQAVCFKALHRLLEDFGSGRGLHPVVSPTEMGRQWYHPTAWQYLSGRLRGAR